jgi:hypothetical protein
MPTPFCFFVEKYARPPFPITTILSLFSFLFLTLKVNPLPKPAKANAFSPCINIPYPGVMQVMLLKTHIALINA